METKQPRPRFKFGRKKPAAQETEESSDPTKPYDQQADLSIEKEVGVAFEESEGLQRVEWESLRDDFYAFRDSYSRICAQRASRTFNMPGGKASKSALQSAEEKYLTSRRELIAHEAMLDYCFNGLDDESVKTKSESDLKTYDLSFADSILTEHLAATDKFEKPSSRHFGEITYSLPHKVEAVEEKNTGSSIWVNKKLEDFYSWWGNLDDGTKSGKRKKRAALVVTALPFTAISAVAAPAIGAAVGAGGVALGAAAATKISKNALVYQLEKKSGAKKGAQINRVQSMANTIKEAIQNGEGQNVAAIARAQTEHKARENKIEMAKIVGAVALGTLAGEALHAIFADVSHSAPKSPATSRPNTSTIGHGVPPKTTPLSPPKPLIKPPHPKIVHKAAHHAARIIKNSSNIPVRPGDTVAEAFERKYGLHEGFTKMKYLARLAIADHKLSVDYPCKGDPNYFWYVGKHGQTGTRAIIRILTSK